MKWIIENPQYVTVCHFWKKPLHYTNVNAFTFWPISYAWLTEKRTQNLLGFCAIFLLCMTVISVNHHILPGTIAFHFSAPYEGKMTIWLTLAKISGVSYSWMEDLKTGMQFYIFFPTVLIILEIYIKLELLLS